MEELRKLEQVQSTIRFMQSQGIVSSSTGNNSDADRFVADFILLLIQPCGKLDMEKKFHLIYENLPKISAAFHEEALLSTSGQGPNSLHTNCDDMAMIGLSSMQEASSTLEDFCRSYFMFHDMDACNPQSVFKYLPVLSFTESYIYQLDRLNEKMLQLQMDAVTSSEQDLDMEVGKTMKLFKVDPFRPLVLLLTDAGLLTERIQRELRFGEEYWSLERKLCCALTSNQEISVEDVMQAIRLKSFDYRVLNLLLYQLRGEKVNELHMEFLSVSEFLVELSDDLFDYEEDVLNNNFNVLRMFVRIYGASTAPKMLAKCITEAEDKYDCLLKAMDSNLSMNYQRRCEEATKEGGKTSGPPLGSWTIPPIIEDEDLSRLRFQTPCGQSYPQSCLP